MITRVISWFVLLAVVAVSAVGGYYAMIRHISVVSQLEQAQSELADLRAPAGTAETAADIRVDDIKNALGDGIQAAGVLVVEEAGGVRVIIPAEALFTKMEVSLNDQGVVIAGDLATYLAEHRQLHIEVRGRSNAPDKVAVKAGYTSNWDLSAARGLAVIQHLRSKGNVDVERLRLVVESEAESGDPRRDQVEFFVSTSGA